MVSAFPNCFIDEPTVLEIGIDAKGNDAIKRLQSKGYHVAIGLSKYYAGAIGIMGRQDHIREYCPKDSTESRFASMKSTEKWLQKGGGRAVFLLLSGIQNDGQLEGYGWTGLELNHNLPNHPITSAYRLGSSVLGLGLATDFVQTVVSATNKYYAKGRGIGLETWESNHAMKIYNKVGFEVIKAAESEELRPTISKEASDGLVPDRRIYMGHNFTK